MDRRLDGVEVSAAPKLQPDHIPPEQLGARGEGSRSAVYVSRPDGSAHVFNAVNTKHGVVFLDGQSGALGILEKNVSSIGHIPYRDGSS
ncbi:toxin glutamine deamidase domain-containing protein [Streptomyces sp. NPDC006132]|uniref:toxin glutamine deamidase domain-containing protein n=1 Tax=Streptomyces sp. NPDC006132 TaxID=3156732 RepID=UPI00340EC873